MAEINCFGALIALQQLTDPKIRKMKLIQLNTEISVFENMHELDPADHLLMKKALEACNLSYSPYSHFKVGAALELENGAIVTGANQENAAYPLCLCAEQVALHHASIQHPGVKIKTIAITAISKEHPLESPPPPCGACRQVLTEYEFRHKKDIRIILGIPDGMHYLINSAKQLLPLHFDPSFLK
jgi:cytidine deaminase